MNTVGICDRDYRFDIFTLCEAAVDVSGRLSLLGTIEGLAATQFPLDLKKITVALRVRVWPEEGVKHHVRLLIVDPDGHTVGNEVNDVFTFAPTHGDRAVGGNVVVEFLNVRLTEPGSYTVDFYWNGALEGRCPFYAEPLAPS